jgi:hypothetical protein
MCVAGTTENTTLLLLRVRFSRNVFIEPLLSNEVFRLSGVMSHYFYFYITSPNSNLTDAFLTFQYHSFGFTEYARLHEKMMNDKEVFGRKQWWAVSRNYPGTRLEDGKE